MNPELDLASLQPGDRVGIRCRDSYSTGTVYRLTTTQVIISVDTAREAPLHRKFRLKDGYEVGQGFGPNLVHPEDHYLIACAARELFSRVFHHIQTQLRELQNRQRRAHVGPVQVWEQLQLLQAEITKAQEKASRLIERMPKPERPE